MNISPESVAALFVVALVAGWVDAIAGGGGMITVPSLLAVGLPPAAAIATNKLQGRFGALTAALYFLRRGAVSLNKSYRSAIAVCAGSVLGGWAVTRIDAAQLALLVPVLLIFIGAYFLFFAGNLDERREPLMSQRQFDGTAAPALGFYDGFFGPGTGSFMAMAFVALRGLPIRSATAQAKLFNFVSNLSALVYFVFFGQIFWLVGVTMIGGQVIGAYLGAQTALKGGAKTIRPIIISVSFVMCGREIWKIISKHM